MAHRAVTWLGDDRNALLDHRTTVTLTPDQLAAPLLCKRSSLVHDDIPRYDLGKLLTTSGLADKA